MPLFHNPDSEFRKYEDFFNRLSDDEEDRSSTPLKSDSPTTASPVASPVASHVALPIVSHNHLSLYSYSNPIIPTNTYYTSLSDISYVSEKTKNVLERLNVLLKETITSTRLEKSSYNDIFGPTIQKRYPQIHNMNDITKLPMNVESMWVCIHLIVANYILSTKIIEFILIIRDLCEFPEHFEDISTHWENGKYKNHTLTDFIKNSIIDLQKYFNLFDILYLNLFNRIRFYIDTNLEQVKRNFLKQLITCCHGVHHNINIMERMKEHSNRLITACETEFNISC